MNCVLEASRLNSFDWKKVINFFVSISKIFLPSSIEVLDVRTIVSSAYWISSVSLSRYFCMSFMYKLNSSGPRTVPWGTPLVSSTGSDRMFRIFTCCSRWDRKLLINSLDNVLKPNIPNFSSGILWFIESKALDKSSRAADTYFFLSVSDRIISVQYVIASVVENLFLNPYCVFVISFSLHK